MRSTRRTRPEGPTGSVRGTGRLAVLAAAGLAAAALVAGCGSSASSGGSPPTNPPASSSAPSVPGTSAATLRTTTDGRLGTVVTDSAGFTLYRFDKDSATPPTATCNGDCATLWPPAPADGTAVTTGGIDAKLVGTVTRADGSKQLTLAGRPLYRYAPDRNPGDTKGQGVQGVWFAVTPAGDRAAATSGGSGY
ncbi:Predicted lipoprotein with conserved Yx(FWY)xxD motif [Streptomyces sp. TLI_053]|uniref:COG4315 family predicted lipoprotein n=1 Tax=Streptomyces sp. TLI_053 TaxID=1855352 RepID=UPI00087B6668|nr:hypothetical protein [Streptomyces sp. TLI_053]SDT79320.1 Predicted lipoprotein with conserved Yx(FWY)xxD motif [Streptomyces sp. TLI_053]